jgi:hypothetical protein
MKYDQANQSINRSKDSPMNETMKLSINQSINQSINGPIKVNSPSVFPVLEDCCISAFLRTAAKSV